MNRWVLIFPGLAVVLAAAAACTPDGPRLSAGVAVPGGAPAVAEHTLSPADQFEIRLPFAADYNDRVTVGTDGTVAPRAIGSVMVGGLTVAEATERLKQHYAKRLKAPDLSITMRRYAPEVIYVDGWVARPGLIRSDIPLTLARALARAGGVRTGASTGEVLIMRNSGDGARAFSVALGSYAGAGAQDPLLKSFDVVYVPQTAIAAVSDFARQYYSNIPLSVRFDASPSVAPAIVTPTTALPAAAPP